MTNEQKMGVLKLIFSTIFLSKAQNTDITQVIVTTNMGNFPGRWFKEGLIRGFDLAINTGDKIVSIRCVEQNPNKMDKFNNLGKYANLARQGHQIMWVIDKNTENGFLGRIQDNEWVPSFVPATTPAPNDYDYNTPEHELRVDAAYAHIEKDINDPNFHGCPGTSDTCMENVPYQQQNLPQPDIQNPAEAQNHSLDIADLPEIPNGGDIPEYVLESMAEMDEPPDWGDDYE